jgi:branched-chain amino acid transport system permease protein
MSAPAVDTEPPRTWPRLRRSERSTLATSSLLGVVVLVLAVLPYVAFADVTDALVTFFVLLTISTMWNLLAGFGGLVSVGQQAWIGLGAYAALALADAGLSPFLAVPLAAVVCGVIALPTSLLAFRLRGDYFAVGTWVIAEVFRLVVVNIGALGGGSGKSLTGLAGLDPAVRQALTYWVALAVAVLALLGSYLLLRSRTGLALTAVRDDETRAKRIVYLASAAGCGAGGAVLLLSQLSVQPDFVFSVQWSAYMIFIVVIGGLGYLEGAIVGSIVFFALQQGLADRGVTYLVVLGIVAVVAALRLPRGGWGWLADRTGLRLFPVGYHQPELERAPGARARGVRGLIGPRR